MKHGKLISLSGGRSSAMMLKIMLDNGQVDDTTVIGFANTGKEHPKTLEFVQNIEKHWGIKIWWVEYTPKKPLYKIVNFKTASRNGRPFDQLNKKRAYLPNRVKRICTGDLKIKVLNRLMKKKLGFKTYDKYLGIRYDEPHRAARNRDHKLPLYDLRITKLQRNQFWEAQPFQLEIHDYYGNCDLCFWKPDWLIIKMIRENPGIEKWWIDQENRAGATFKKEISYTQLAYLAGSQRQILFPENQDYPMECNCKDH